MVCQSFNILVILAMTTNSPPPCLLGQQGAGGDDHLVQVQQGVAPNIVPAVWSAPPHN